MVQRQKEDEAAREGERNRQRDEAAKEEAEATAMAERAERAAIQSTIDAERESAAAVTEETAELEESTTKIVPEEEKPQTQEEAAVLAQVRGRFTPINAWAASDAGAADACRWRRVLCD